MQQPRRLTRRQFERNAHNQVEKRRLRVEKKDALKKLLSQQDRIKNLPIPAEGVNIEPNTGNRQNDPLDDENPGQGQSGTKR